jgi:D-alanyl-D-alanine carboxypeptidase
MNQTNKILFEQVGQNKTASVQYILFNKDSILMRYSYGLADIKANKSVNDLTTYHAFSVTKTFTALSILQLAERKKLDIDDSIKNYLSGFPYSSNTTIRQVLSHSAGIPNPIPLNWIHLAKEHDTFDRNAFFKKIFFKNSKTKSQPNDKFVYSNLGYVLLGQLIEKVTGLSYELCGRKCYQKNVNR